MRRVDGGVDSQSSRGHKRGRRRDLPGGEVDAPSPGAGGARVSDAALDAAHAADAGAVRGRRQPERAGQLEQPERRGRPAEPGEAGLGLGRLRPRPQARRRQRPGDDLRRGGLLDRRRPDLAALAEHPPRRLGRRDGSSWTGTSRATSRWRPPSSGPQPNFFQTTDATVAFGRDESVYLLTSTRSGTGGVLDLQRWDFGSLTPAPQTFYNAAGPAYDTTTSTPHHGQPDLPMAGGRRGDHADPGGRQQRGQLRQRRDDPE